MGRPRLLLAMVVTCAAASGCASSSDRRSAWVARNGGLCADRAAACRVQALAADVGPSPVTVAVLDRADLTAFSWPDGHVYLSRGLLEALDDELLTAAIAHEVGHLLNHRTSDRPAALGGAAAALAAETEADRAGMQLLIDGGQRPDAMPRMLRRVLMQPGLPTHVKAQLTRRIALLGCSHVSPPPLPPS